MQSFGLACALMPLGRERAAVPSGCGDGDDDDSMRLSTKN